MPDAAGAIALDAAGAIALDVGSGEMKLYALLLQPAVEVHELKLVKRKASDAATQLAAGNPTIKEDICAQLEEGLLGLPALVSKRPVRFEHAIVGATAWYRQLSPLDRKKADTFLETIASRLTAKLASLNDVDWRVSQMQSDEISGAEEADFEYAAVQHALDGNALEPCDGVLAGGNGSMQISGHACSMSCEAGLAEGIAILERCESRADGIAKWRSQITSTYGQCPDPQNMREMYVRRFHLHLVCVSGFYYGAMAAGVVKKGEAYKYMPAQGVRAQLRKLIEDPKAQAKDVANAVRLDQTLELLVDGHLERVECLFARDWKINGNPFRSTWVAGWGLALRKTLARPETSDGAHPGDSTRSSALVSKEVSGLEVDALRQELSRLRGENAVLRAREVATPASPKPLHDGMAARTSKFEGSTASHSAFEASFESHLVQQVLAAATAASHDGSVDMLAFAMHEMPSGVKLINSTDAIGKSALMIATEQGDVGAVRVLLTAGADRRLKDRDGHTPLMVATRRKNEEVIAEFKRADGVLHNIAPDLEEQHERISSLVLDLGTGEMKLLAYTQSPQTEVPTAIVAVPSCRPHLFHLL